ncbi:hypothetical protein CEP53_008224 [Fusarium sp. AF-6]|nr:hypothetical protein CEP53_008224 [Fusarium sp. AF-6]
MAKNPQKSGRPVEQPRFHFFTNNWINDPCAPGYDPWTKTYHLFYQCNPEECEWGNMSWGHVVSKDMLTWSLASTSPALTPDQPYDSQGVFTGCWIPPSDAEDKTSRVAYSSAIDDDNVEEWTYLGPLVDIPARFQPSKKWSGNYGINWECTNIVTLHAGSESRHFLIIGAEGDVEKAHVKNHDQPTGVPSRIVRGQLWMSGNLTRVDDGVRFGYEHGGYLDHGPLYAANSFVEPVSKRHIVYAWIPEEDISLDAAKQKGWNGSLAIPREIFLLRVPNVERTLRSTLAECCPFEVKTEADGSTTILTLGVKPIDEMTRLREECTGVVKLETAMMLPDKTGLAHLTVYQTQSSSWELEAIISVNSECESLGFNIRHNQDLSIHTTITFCTITERIIVNREASTTDTTINKYPDAGPYTLLMQKKENGLEMEKLHLRIFSDGDILEVFANGRFALATMVYSQSYEQENSGIMAFANGSTGSAVFESVTVWDGLDAKERCPSINMPSEE